MMKIKNKIRVTVNGWYKLLATLVFIGFSLGFFVKNASVGMALLLYSWLFIFLAVIGSNCKVAKWLAKRDFFIYLFVVPLVIGALYSLIIYGDAPEPADYAFAVLLTILSIPVMFLMLWIQGGIRRWSGMIAFVALPCALYLLCKAFPEKLLSVALIGGLITFGFFFITATIEHSRDHRADMDSSLDKGRGRHCTATWDGQPDSIVENQVIRLRGKVIVEYSGDFYERDAKNAAQKLIDKYVMRVERDMPGYTIEDAEVMVEYVQVD